MDRYYYESALRGAQYLVSDLQEIIDGQTPSEADRAQALASLFLVLYDLLACDEARKAHDLAWNLYEMLKEVAESGKVHLKDATILMHFGFKIGPEDVMK